jgi:hypothetical protein
MRSGGAPRAPRPGLRPSSTAQAFGLGLGAGSAQAIRLLLLLMVLTSIA